jgi:hypothetical protein
MLHAICITPFCTWNSSAHSSTEACWCTVACADKEAFPARNLSGCWRQLVLGAVTTLVLYACFPASLCLRLPAQWAVVLYAQPGPRQAVAVHPRHQQQHPLRRDDRRSSSARQLSTHSLKARISCKPCARAAAAPAAASTSRKRAHTLRKGRSGCSSAG